MHGGSFSALYIIGIVALVGISVAGIIFTPGASHAGLYALVGPLTVGLIALLRAEQAHRMTQRIEVMTKATHDLVNSELDEFKQTISELEHERGHTEGMAQGRAEAEARTDVLDAAKIAVVQHEGVIRHEGVLPEADKQS